MAVDEYYGNAHGKKSEKNEYDLFVTAMRRKYIPPLMECFQDILVISYYNYEAGKNSEEILPASEEHLKTIHQKVVDTFHPITRICPDIYFVLVG